MMVRCRKEKGKVEAAVSVSERRKEAAAAERRATPIKREKKTGETQKIGGGGDGERTGRTMVGTTHFYFFK